jgi:TonB-linked SusC/RagA family outer membrane protein
MRKLTFLMTFLLLVVFSASAQTQISGTVTNAESGDPIPGASIVVKGQTTVGTSTDMDGNYTLSGIPSDAQTLVFSFVGMESQEVAISGRSTINVALNPSVTEMEEIIVAGVAAGTPKKKLSVSVSKVGGEDLQEVPASSASQALQGKVAGVEIVQPSGDPGSSANIVIRGATQIVGSQEPLIIVDGTMVDGTLADINVEDIESYEVVKGASASALYGSRAGNGVIVITTKTGSSLDKGETSVRIRNQYGVSRLANKYDLATHHEYRLADDWQSHDYTKFAGVSFPDDYQGGTDPDIDGSRMVAGDNYMDNPYIRTFDQQEKLFSGNDNYTNYVSVAHNSGKTNLMTSFENRKEGGLIDFVEGYERQNYRINVDHQLSDKISLSAKNLYINSTTRRLGGQNAYNGGIFFNLMLMQPNVNLENENPDGQPYQFLPDPWMATTENPLYMPWKIDRVDERDRLISSFSGSYSPFEWAKLDAKYAFEMQNSDYEEYEPYSTYERGGSGAQYSKGSLYRYNSKRFDETMQATLNLHQVFGDVTAKGKLSYLYERRQYEWFDAYGSNFAFDIDRMNVFDNVDNVANISADNASREEVAKNYMGILSLDYKEKYIFDGMYRMDGSSLFGEDERWNAYYRVSAAYRISEDITIPGVQELKLRGAYGTSGQRPGFSYQYEVMSLSRGGASKSTLGNTELKPSRSIETEVGLNAQFLNIFDFEFIYANVVTEDQFLQAPQAVHLGGWQYRWLNAGTLESNAIEMTLGAQIAQKSDFKMHTSLIYDQYRSEITGLDIPPYQTGPEGQDATLFYIREGEVFGMMYGYKFLQSLDEMEKQLAEGESIEDYEINSDGYVVPLGSQGTNEEIPQLLRDENGTPVRTKIGDPNPDFHLKSATRMSWKGFSAYMLWDWKQGGDIYNRTGQWLTRDNRAGIMDQSGKAPNEKKTVAYYKAFYQTNSHNNFWIEDGTYIKLREFSLYYTLDSDVMGGLFNNFIKEMKIGVIGKNLLTITNYSGYDPEVQTENDSGTQGFAYDFAGYPNFRTISGSLEFKF